MILVRKLKDAKLDLTASDVDVAEGVYCGCASGQYSVTDNAGTQTVDIRKAADKTIYAKVSTAPAAFKVTGDLGDGLEKSVEDFRNKKLFDFGFMIRRRLKLRDDV
jgi:hypothetical protein